MTLEPAHLLGVAACGGTRCRALRELAVGAGDTPLALRAAVASRPDAALISTECLGACHLACLVVVGRAVYSGAGRLRWTDPPTAVPLAERDGRTDVLAQWIRQGAPDGLPAALRRSA